MKDRGNLAIGHNVSAAQRENVLERLQGQMIGVAVGDDDGRDVPERLRTDTPLDEGVVPGSNSSLSPSCSNSKHEWTYLDIRTCLPPDANSSKDY